MLKRIGLIALVLTIGGSPVGAIAALSANERISIAQDHVAEGDRAFRERNWLEAMSEYELALHYTPEDKTVRSKYESAKAKVKIHPRAQTPPDPNNNWRFKDPEMGQKWLTKLFALIAELFTLVEPNN